MRSERPTIRASRAPLPSRRQTLWMIGGGMASLTLAACQQSPGPSAVSSKAQEIPMKRRPKVVAFDVIETLFSLDPMKDTLKSIGLPAEALEVWFAQLLRDAMALEIVGDYKPFSDVARSALEVVMTKQGLEPAKDKVQQVLDGFTELPAHPDVAPAIKMLHDAGVRVLTLTNGSEKNTKQLLKNAELDDYIEKSISIDDVKHWKPSKEVYLYAAQKMGVEPKNMTLVAAHGWDIHGSNRAGLSTAYISRGKPFPSVMKSPDIEGERLEEIARSLLDRS
jgi:2-haloacid dehalogenase